MRTACVVGILVSLVASGAWAHPRVPENPIERLASEAAAAYHSADYARAAELLERAYKLEPVSALLYNLGKVYDKLGQKQKAADYYERYAMADDAEPRLKQKAEARAAQLRAPPRLPVPERHPPKPVVKAPPPPPPRPVVVAQPLPPPPPPPRRDPHRVDKALVIGFGSLAGGALVTAVGLSANAFVLHDQYTKSLDETQKRAWRTDAQAQALAADILYGVTAASVAVGAYFLYRWLKPERPEHVAIAPWAAPSGGGLAAGGVF